MVAWSMGSPVLFRQRRIGIDERPFDLVKFRTMRHALDRNGKSLPDHERITKLGQILRKSSLDELPELWNILRGEMSLVGPRPLLPEYLPFYSDLERSRHSVRPGLTGLAQVSGRNSQTWDDRLSLDVQYARSVECSADLQILAKTVGAVLSGDGVNAGESTTMTALNIERTIPRSNVEHLKPIIVVIGGLAMSLINFREPLLLALQQHFSVVAMAGQGDEKTRSRLATLGIPFVELPLGRTSLNPWKELLLVATIRKQLRLLNADAVFTYTVKPVCFGLIAAQFAGIKNRSAMITGLGFGLIGESKPRKALAFLVRCLYKTGLRGASVVFFQNPDDQGFFQKHKLLSDVTKIELVRGSGVNTGDFTREQYPNNKRVQFVFVGRFLIEKGLRELIEAVKILKKSHQDKFGMTLIGWNDPNPQGITAEEVQGWSAEKLVTNIGKVSDVRPYLQEMDVFVLPSYREGTPRSALEAMSMGLPVITTDVPGCREVVVDQETGFLVPPRSADSLAKAMATFIDNPARIAALGVNGRHRVTRLYEASVVAKAMADRLFDEAT
jgi:lipopolysaccharide/colanic/teichoic acid biosynthesis glycosyltransferase/glycosyltransferase involved in cell wall biosynthesis